MRREDSSVKLYMKQDELDDMWFPASGVRLFESVPSIENLTVSLFREDHEYSAIFESVSRKYFTSCLNRKSTEEVVEIRELWEQRIQKLIDLPQCRDLRPFDLNCLKPQTTPSSSISMMPSLQVRKDAVLKVTFLLEFI